MYHDDLESQKENSIEFEAERALDGLDSWWGPACSILLKIHDAALMRKLGLTQPLGRAASYDFAWAKLEQEKMELAWNFATELGGSLSWSQLLYKYAMGSQFWLLTGMDMLKSMVLSVRKALHVTRGESVEPALKGAIFDLAWHRPLQ